MMHRKLLWWVLLGSLLEAWIVTPALGQEAILTSTVLSPRNANYTMDVRLDTESKIITGKAVLNWTNITNHPTPDLRFHLYYNAWRNDKSSFLTSVRYDSFDLSPYKDEEWAYNQVKQMGITYEDGREVDLTPVLEFIQPDDANPYDRTVLRAPLPLPVAPGATIYVEFQWEAKVPRTFARTGTIGDYYFIAQWFPKIGVFQADGTWNCHQFIQTEFYADYGNYDVKLTVPTGWVVGATGREIEKQDNEDGTTTHRYYQEDVHDFVWTTSRYFQEHTAQFDDPLLPPVEMRLLLMPDHAAKKDRYFDATRAALKYYGTWFGPYPYDHLTIVDPAYQSRTGGMEYPTLFTGGTRWLSPPATLSPEGVTVHEAGHQFWYGIIGNDEFEHAWLDEGFNTYSTRRTLETAYPPPVLIQRYFEGFIPLVFDSVRLATPRTGGADGYAGFYSNLKLDPMATISWKFGPKAYRINSYNKPAMMLRILENYLGWDTFQKVMATYFERWKFRHPQPHDFFAIVNEVSGQDMGWFFKQTYNSSNVFDYAVESVKSRPLKDPKGYVEKEGKLVFETPEQDEQADENKLFSTTVFVRRWGESIFPVEVEVTFADSEQVTEQWDGKARWARFDYTKRPRIDRVFVDPQHKLVLDINYSNNSWLRQPPATIAATKWTAKWMIWLQSLMEFVSFFA